MIKIMVLGRELVDVAEQMVKIARLTGKPCTTYFCNIHLIANPDSSVDSIVDFYHKEYGRRCQEYSESPIGKCEAQDNEARRLADQAKLDQLMVKLPTIDFDNLTALVNWFDEYSVANSHIGVNLPWQQIIEIYSQHGFVPDMNCNADFNSEDEASYARYLIGQALKCLTYNAHVIYQNYGNLVDDWRKKFNKAV